MSPRLLVSLAAALAVAGTATADPPAVDRERAAKAAFAFAGVSRPPVTEAVPPAVADRLAGAKAAFAACRCEPAGPCCDCHDTGRCPCAPGTCKCCADALPAYGEAMLKKAADKRLVVVAYLGTTKGTCFDGALSGADPHAAAKRIVVGYPEPSGRMAVSEELPADASRERIAAAVKVAMAKRDGPPKVMPATPPPAVQAPAFFSMAPVQSFAPVCRT